MLFGRKLHLLVKLFYSLPESDAPLVLADTAREKCQVSAEPLENILHFGVT